MRFHALGLPHTVSSKQFNACAYTQKVVKFGKMMTERGHEVIHYGHEDSDLQCTEHVTVLTNDDFKKSYGSHDWRKTFFKFDTGDHAYQTFYKNAIEKVGKRKQKNDFILPFWGSGVRPICDAHQDLICVEPGIGYAGGHWARFKVFESYAIYHAYAGMQGVGNCRQDWYEVVIPNYFDIDDFDYNEKKEDYYLYLGRVYSGKGVEIAIQATEILGKKLVIAGQKEEGYNLPDHVEYVGYADVNKRKKLMSNATASILRQSVLAGCRATFRAVTSTRNPRCIPQLPAPLTHTAAPPCYGRQSAQWRPHDRRTARQRWLPCRLLLAQRHGRRQRPAWLRRSSLLDSPRLERSPAHVAGECRDSTG